MSGRGPSDHERGAPSAGGPAGPEPDLLGDLRRAVARHDPLPAGLDALARSLFSWRDPDAELASLVADSRQLAAAVRAGSEEVLLRFESESHAVTFEAIADGAGRFRLTGHLEPGGAGRLDVCQLGGSGGDLAVDCDEWGRFEAHPVAPGPIRLSWAPSPDGRRVHTAWVVI
jgi:hypothetical protein